MSYEQTIASILGGVGLCILALGKFAWNSAKKEAGKQTAGPMNSDETHREMEETRGLIRQQHQEMRIDHRELRDKLVSIEIKLDSLIRR